jgi:hypothetical protein
MLVVLKLRMDDVNGHFEPDQGYVRQKSLLSTLCLAT